MLDKRLFILLIVAAVIGVIFWSVGGSEVKDIAPYYLKKAAKETARVEIGGKVIEAEVADSQAAREKGLSGRQALGFGKGMIFVFNSPGIYQFTTKKMKFSLDIIWINGNKIVYLARRVPPGVESVNPNVQADYVLEVGSGVSDSWSIGDEVRVYFDKK